jgi:uncharacterized protein YaaQ
VARSLAGRKGDVKLLVAVVNRDDMYALIDALMRAGYDATIINTTGGFLREGNATLLIGVEADEVGVVLRIVADNCHTRVKRVVPPPVLGQVEMPPGLAPIEVEVGGAVVFTMTVEQFVRI